MCHIHAICTAALQVLQYCISSVFVQLFVPLLCMQIWSLPVVCSLYVVCVVVQVSHSTKYLHVLPGLLYAYIQCRDAQQYIVLQYIAIYCYQYIGLVYLNIAIYCIGDIEYCNILYWEYRILQYIVLSVTNIAIYCTIYC